MPAKRYVAIDSTGGLTEVAATVASAGAGSDGNLLALDSSGRIDASALPIGVGLDAVSCLASEALAAGALVNIWLNTGVASVRNADASAGVGKMAHGFVATATSSGQMATIFLDSGAVISGLSGLSAGVTYLLSASTPGTLTAIAPATAGQISQQIGVALSATSLKFEPKAPITRA
jgi:hypothetical protein